MEAITVGYNKCNEANDRIDLSKYANLKNVSIGDFCFKNQDVLNLTGLRSLERVSIGMNSVTKRYNTWGNNPNRALYVKNCDKLKELRMGRYSFSDYSVIEIENVDKLEVLEIGDLNEESYNFYAAPLELRGGLWHLLLIFRLTKVTITSPWWEVIRYFFWSCARECVVGRENEE